MTEDYQYKVGGGLPKNAPSYVFRKADSQFYQRLKAGDFCFVFNCRQMGKTSLLNQTMKRLQDEGFACANIDLTEIGTGNLEQWYAGIAYILVTRLKILEAPQQFLTWWNERINLSPVQRFGLFIEELLLQEINNNIIIFIDEIDTILSFKSCSNDFFALIRSCYEKRNLNVEYKRLTFALLGVATPSDLIDEKRRTPFNIGHPIQLNGFKEEEIKPLAKGLTGKVSNIEEVMRAVLRWTGGQPFLTQKVCKLILQELSTYSKSYTPKSNALDWVGRVVRKQIINNWESLDEPEHLRTIRKRVVTDDRFASSLLGLYQQILESSVMEIDGSPEQIQLRLTGLVVEQNSQLKVYNLIYQSVFNLEWVGKELEKLRPYAETLKAWIETNYQDESRLLRGQALEKALIWAEDKRLSNDDYKFLDASRELEKRSIQRQLKAQAKANEFLLQARQQAEIALEEQKQASQRLLEARQEEEKVNQRLLEAQKNTEIILEEERKTNQRLLEVQKNTEVLLEEERKANQRKLKAQEEVNEFLFQARQQAEVALEEQKQASQRLLKARQEEEKANQRLLEAQKNTEIILAEERKTNRRLLEAQNNIEITLEQERESNKLLVQTQQNLENTLIEEKVVNKRLNKLQKRTQRVLLIGVFGLIIVVMLAGIWFNKARETEIAANLELNGALVQKQFENDPLGALVRAMEIARKLQKEVSDGRSLEKYPALNPMLALQNILVNIKERNHSQNLGLILKPRQLTFSPDGQYFATAGETVALWDSKGKKLDEFHGKKSSGKCFGSCIFTSVSFNHYSNQIAAAQSDGSIVLLEISGQQLVKFQEFKTDLDIVNSVSFSPDSKLLVTTSQNDAYSISIFRKENKAFLWNLSGDKLAEFQGHTDIINSINFSHDGQFIATASADNTARLWNLAGEIIAELKGHESRVNDINFSPNNSDLIATASSDNTVRLWNLSGQEIKKIKAGVHSIFSVNFSPDGQQIVTGGGDGKVRFWNLSGEQLSELKVSPNPVFNVTFSPNGKQFATAGDYMLRLFDLSGTKTTREFDLLKDTDITNFDNNYQIVETVSFSSDGKFIATTQDGIVRIWDLFGKIYAEIEQPKNENNEKNEVSSVTFSPDSKFIATVENKKALKRMVRLWDLTTKPTPRLFKEFKEFIPIFIWSYDYEFYDNYISFSSDGSLFIIPDFIIPDKTSNSDCCTTIQLKNLSDEVVKEFTTKLVIKSLKFSSDEQKIVVGGTLYKNIDTKEYWIEVYNLYGKKIEEFKVPKGVIIDTVNNPDDTIIASTSYDEKGTDYGTVWLWKLSGEKLAEFKPYQGLVKTVRFSPNGKIVATSGIDSTIKLWNLNGRQVGEFKLGQNNSKLKAEESLYPYKIFEDNRPRNYVNWMSFSPDGKKLAAACNDGMIRLFEVDNLEKMLERGCDWLDDYLATRPEKRKEICPDNK
ncbi:AAA-like domain-containing protein [Nostoc punctiforme FACHB-252]|uniref:AAA-like domain-containing protein n=1 Tax=Nostoc punctiforme FACHB-252 TaxID=1357509 RepID=A0ABR8HA79_NOSPU|nr:AAA-like domain-containing protein [Nostoc punctiforme]MBD2612085.1 AAA-like domain-containing protein [Nostoc punctiforme FACHB-252]